MQVPGIFGMEHIGFTVPGINEACERILGAQTLYTAAKDFRHDDDCMQEHLHVHPRAVIKEFRHLRSGNGTNLEVFKYEAPDQNTTPSKNSDIGGHHLAFYVENMDAAIAYLRENGVEVLGEPTACTERPNLGLTWCYFRDAVRLGSDGVGRRGEASTAGSPLARPSGSGTGGAGWR